MSVSTQERRANREIYYKEQNYTTEKYVVPYINTHKTIIKDLRILEIGCGEGGNLKYFIDLGCEVMGIDINLSQLEKAKYFTKKFCENTSNANFLDLNIYDAKVEETGKFDIIMMRDVIEHIPNQEQFIGFLKQFIKKDGIIFFGFPPWYMPFGGHQQGCKSILRKTPYFHILPKAFYKGILKFFGEPDGKIANLLQTRSTGISIERFKKIVRENDWKILDETLYLINPNYEAKFKLKPKKQYKILATIPFFRNFLTTCAYFIITPQK